MTIHLPTVWLRSPDRSLFQVRGILTDERQVADLPPSMKNKWFGSKSRPPLHFQTPIWISLGLGSGSQGFLTSKDWRTFPWAYCAARSENPIPTKHLDHLPDLLLLPQAPIMPATSLEELEAATAVFIFVQGTPMSNPNDSTPQLIQSQFGAVARNYATSKVHAQGEDLPVLLDLARLTGQEYVLDAGCGPGPVTLLMAPQARAVTAIDFTSAMLDIARESAAARQLDNVSFQLNGLEDFHAPDAAFDRVVTRFSAHHWPDPLKVLSRFREVVGPDGYLLHSDVMASEVPVLDTFLQAAEILRDPSHVRDHTSRQWQEMCRAAGFEPRMVHSWPLRLEFGPWVKRMATTPARIAALHQLFNGAGADVRAAFDVGADCSFTVPCGILRADPV